MAESTKHETHYKILQLIPFLGEEQLVDLFEREMLEDGYLSNDGLWENAREWLKDYLNECAASENWLEETLQDMQCKVDYPDS